MSKIIGQRLKKKNPERSDLKNPESDLNYLFTTPSSSGCLPLLQVCIFALLLTEINKLLLWVLSHTLCCVSNN